MAVYPENTCGSTPVRGMTMWISRFVLWLVFPAIIISLAACALNPGIRTTAEPNASLVYGFFDMEESPYALQSVTITQNEKVGIVYRQSHMQTYTDGLFFVENLPPMKYHIPFFRAGNVTHVLSTDERDLFSVAPAKLVYIGAFRYHDPKKGGVFTAKKFEMLPVKKPSEAEVLLLLADRVKDPRWKERIRARLRDLNR